MTIIANPPYEYGNEITKTVLENIDFDNYINIMPMSGYKKNNLAAYIIKTEPLPRGAFKDASTNPYVSVLSKEAKEISKEEAEIESFRDDLKKFYITNLEKDFTFRYEYTVGNSKTEEGSRQILSNYTTITDFLVTVRTAFDGIHVKAKAMDRKWNLEKSINFEDIPVYYNKSKTGLGWYHPAVGFIRFNTPEEHKNFCNWWYTANLSEKLIKGMNKQSGSIIYAIPRVDWSRPWTDEEILREFGYNAEEIEEILK